MGAHRRKAVRPLFSGSKGVYIFSVAQFVEAVHLSLCWGKDRTRREVFRCYNIIRCKGRRRPDEHKTGLREAKMNVRMQLLCFFYKKVRSMVLQHNEMDAIFAPVIQRNKWIQFLHD